MDYTSAPGYVTDAQGRRQYQDRDLLNGVKGTSLVKADRNAIMNSLMYLIQTVQIIPNPNDDSQVWAAIEAMIKAALVGVGGTLNFMPVQQGAASGDAQMGQNKVNIGWDITGTYRLRYYVDGGATADATLATTGDVQTVQSNLTTEITRATNAEAAEKARAEAAEANLVSGVYGIVSGDEQIYALHWSGTGRPVVGYGSSLSGISYASIATYADVQGVQNNLTTEIARATNAESALSSAKANRSGDTFSGAVTIDQGSGNSANIFLSSGGIPFWQLQLASSNYGSAFGILRYVAGKYVDTPFSINNATGVATFLEQPVVPAATVPTAPVNLGQLTSMPHGAVTIRTGTTSWTVPSGVYSIDVEAWGGGGGGGAASNGSASGGAGGGYNRGCFSVTPGQVIPVSVGSGGAGGTTGNGSSGGATTMLGMIAPGGSYGLSGVNTNSTSGGGVGGSATGGQVNLTGYVGQGASDYVNGYLAGGMGGGTFQTSNTAFVTGSGNGYSGNFPGGGGSGASSLGSSSYTGGAGANGLIIITW